MSANRSDPSAQAAIKRVAAAWVARQDRGLTAGEQDDYLQWLRESPAHAAAIAEHEDNLQRLMQLSSWQPGSSTDPNPDLFAPRRRWPLYVLPLAAAAAVALTFAYRLGRPGPVPAASASHLVVDEQQTLPDGSRVELRNGSAVEEHYSPTERRVKLMGGEAVFTVEKNPFRPFVVEAAGVDVRAVGTVFDVRLDPASVEVLVTQGKVRVDEADRSTRPPAQRDSGTVFVSAGERAFVPLVGADSVPQIARLSPDKLSDDLAWQAPRFQFYETPLGDAVAEFNRFNRPQLVLDDPRLRSIPIGGTFRADDVAGFAHILQAVMGIRSRPDSAGGFVLSGAH